MALTKSTDPLVWIDCEMTGLDPLSDSILSVSCTITSSLLEPLHPPESAYNATILTSQATLDAMSEWCVTTHGRTGLSRTCTDPSVSVPAAVAARDLLAFIQRHVPTPRTALLAGNSVHMDKAFLYNRAEWRPVVEYLHYRILDVSAIKEGVRRWCVGDKGDEGGKGVIGGSSDEAGVKDESNDESNGDGNGDGDKTSRILANVPKKKLRHEAASDVAESIEEARYYMKLFAKMGAGE